MKSCAVFIFLERIEREWLSHWEVNDDWRLRLPENCSAIIPFLFISVSDYLHGTYYIFCGIVMDYIIKIRIK